MKNFAPTAAVLIALVVAGAGAYYAHSLYKGGGEAAASYTVKADASVGSPTSTGVGAEVVPDVAPASPSASSLQTTAQGMRRYTNSTYHFSLLVPDTLQVSEYPEGGGAMTVTFSDASTTEGFQMYILPYAGTTISPARFAMDEPSGVREQPTDVIIDGVRATMFFSTNAIMGDTREVWFIHGGYLYEVTTYKGLDTWLAGIMQTWQFI